MNDLDHARTLVAAWLQPLPDAAAPCGTDLEYDNDFLALTQAAAGKPESQFGPAEPPDWRAAVEGAETLFERTRDLRIAIVWLRGSLHVLGYAGLPVGLGLIIGLIEKHWDALHPMPDPDDGDMFARANALALLAETEGLIGDLRQARLADDRTLAGLTVRAVEVASGLSPARAGETDLGKAALAEMMAVAVAKTPDLRGQCEQAGVLAKQLAVLINAKLGAAAAPDLRPLQALIKAVAALLPAASGADGEDGDGEEGEGGGAAGSRRGLSGTVNSREEAIRAIDMICDYLERAEPANPAPLFLRRARRLISHNFLQLMKALAPGALAEIAKVVGIDPATVKEPDSA